MRCERRTAGRGREGRGRGKEREGGRGRKGRKEGRKKGRKEERKEGRKAPGSVLDRNHTQYATYLSRSEVTQQLVTSVADHIVTATGYLRRLRVHG
jgi:hypothetical protein